MKSFLQPVPEAKGIGYNHEFLARFDHELAGEPVYSVPPGWCRMTGRWVAKKTKSLSGVKMVRRLRTATAKIKKSVFDPWVPFCR